MQKALKGYRDHIYPTASQKEFLAQQFGPVRVDVLSLSSSRILSRR